MKVQYFYDGQIQRVIKHLIRVFSNFQVRDGVDSTTGLPTYRRVPCRYGDISKQSAYTLKENSENILNSAPIMVINIDNMNISRENVRGPISENIVQAVNAKDSNGNYLNQLDSYYEVERINPIPWDIEFSVNIWTTNQTNKFELFEQIATLFAPAVPFQLTTNPLDWTSMNYIELTDYNMTSRSWPVGDSFDLDISSFKFKTMIWLAVPNKVSRAKIITQIVTNLSTPGLDDMQVPDLGQWDTMYDVYTPGNHRIKLSQTSTNTYQCTLLTRDNTTTPVSWNALIQYYAVNYSNLTLSLLSTLEDATPLICDVSNINANTCTLTLSSLPQTSFSPIDYLIIDNIDLNSIQSGTVVNNGVPFEVNGELFDNSKLLTIANSEFFFTELPNNISAFIGNKNSVYKYNKESNWTAVISEIYNEGLWRLNFI